MMRRLLVFVLLMAAGCSSPEPGVAFGPTCLSGELKRSWLPRAGRLNVLFVLDTSPGMAAHVARLRAAVPTLIDTLMASDREQASMGRTGLASFSSVHAGVVSTDLGGAADGCSEHGEDGVFRAAPDCGVAAGSFSAFAHGSPDNGAALAALDCQLAAAGSGCPDSQPLEAALQALWPPPPMRGVEVEPVDFADGTSGHGDRENLGFEQGGGALLLVFVTDRDDHSAFGGAEPADVARYVRTLSGPQWADVGSVILAGVPSDVKVALEHAELDEHYRQLLDDPRMQPGVMDPVCKHGDAAAYPARRLVEYAQAAGYTGAIVGSLCAEDLTAPIYEWWRRLDSEIIADRISDFELCMSHDLYARASSGLFPCTVTWELPKTRDPSTPQTPIACSERPDFLSEPDARSSSVGPEGGALCEVRQVPVFDPERGPGSEAGDGFFVDVSESAVKRCAVGSLVTFTEAARPPIGVRMTLRCARASYAGSGAEQRPMIGDPCDYRRDRKSGRVSEGDERCQPPSAADANGGRMFCHPDSHVCMQACQTNADCPTGWLCGPDSTTDASVCMNPSCG